MRGPDLRSQVLEIAAREFADQGLHGASIEKIAREAVITQKSSISAVAGVSTTFFESSAEDSSV